MNYLEAVNKKKEMNGSFYFEDMRITSNVFIGPKLMEDFHEYLDSNISMIKCNQMNELGSISYSSNNEFSIWAIFKYGSTICYKQINNLS